MINSYKATYNSGYSQAKMGLAAKNLHRSKGKSCGYYMRIVLFFSSLIQSLIIVSLVLFLVYGEPQQTTEEKRIQELEQGYSRLTLENVALKAKEKNLTQQLNITQTAKKLIDKEVIILRKQTNTSALNIIGWRTKWSQCEMEKKTSMVAPRMSCSMQGTDRYMEHRLRQSEELLKLHRANFTEQMHITKLELENAHKDRIRYQLEGIELRRDKAFLEERIDMYEKKCKEDFIQSLQGIPNVTREFLKRVDDLFSKHISFQLTCEKQSIQLENIRANCSSLSTEVENKLQAYLDTVGRQVTVTVGANAKCMTENKRLREDSTWCYRNRTNIIEQNKKVLKQTQQNNDKEVERLLLDVTKLSGNQKLLDNLLSVKEIEIKMLKDNVKDLNTSLSICKSSQFPGGSSNPFLMSGMTPFGPNKFGNSAPWESRSGQGTLGLGNTGSTGIGSMGSTFGLGSSALGSAGQGPSTFGRTSGSSVGSSGIGFGSTGVGFQKPGSTGMGQPSWPSLGSTGAGVPGLGSVGSAGTGLGSAGTGSLASGRAEQGASG